MKVNFAFVLIFLFSCLGLNVFAQQHKIDSLTKILQSKNDDSSKVSVLHQLYQLTDSLTYAKSELELSEKIGYKSGIALGNLNIGRWYYFDGEEDVALNYLGKSIAVADKNVDKTILSDAYRYLGFIYRPHEPYKALEYYNKSLSLCTETKSDLSASYDLSAIGNVYEGSFELSASNYKKALDYYLQSLAIREKIGSPSEIASSLNETARMYDAVGKYDEANALRVEGLQIAAKGNDIENMVYLNNSLGTDFAERQHDYKKGLDYQLKAFEASKNLKNNFQLSYDVVKSVATDYSSLGDLKNADKFFLLSASLNDSIRLNSKIHDYNLSEIKQKLENEITKEKSLTRDAEIAKGKAEEKNLAMLSDTFIIGSIVLLIFALFMFNAYRQKKKANDSLGLRNQELENAYKSLALSEGNFKQITETINDVFYLYNIKEKKYEYINPNSKEIYGLDQQYFYDGKNSKALVHKDDLQKVIDANVKIDSGIPYEIEYRIIVDGKERWIAEKSSPIFDETGELIRNSGVCRDITRQKLAEEMLRKKNKDIEAGIEYGSKIQNAVLVPETTIAKKLRDFFILLKPKETVSGDFYFYLETKTRIAIAACDCTGHGVPAAFMSMIGNAFLNEIIGTKGIIAPAEILNELRKMIIELLNQQSNSLEINDGIDISLLCIDPDFQFVEFAGAFNPLYLIRQGELHIYQADRFPVGIHFMENKRDFTESKIELEKGDSIYIFSDGYSDQLGENQIRKFGRKSMQNLLIGLQKETMPNQKIALTKKFNEWKGAMEQTDDVLVIGIKI